MVLADCLLRISTSERFGALNLARGLLEPLAGTALWVSAQSAIVKLRQQFNPEF